MIRERLREEKGKFDEKLKEIDAEKEEAENVTTIKDIELEGLKRQLNELAEEKQTQTEKISELTDHIDELKTHVRYSEVIVFI